MQALATAIQQNSLSSGRLEDQILIKASHGIAITAGTVQVCVQNQYLFENAHYARTDIALIVAQAMYNCCGGRDNLQTTCNAKPWVTVKGDTGLAAIATVGRAGDPCKGAPTTKDYLDAAAFVGKTGKVSRFLISNRASCFSSVPWRLANNVIVFLGHLRLIPLGASVGCVFKKEKQSLCLRSSGV